MMMKRADALDAELAQSLQQYIESMQQAMPVDDYATEFIQERLNHIRDPEQTKKAVEFLSVLISPQQDVTETNVLAVRVRTLRPERSKCDAALDVVGRSFLETSHDAITKVEMPDKTIGYRFEQVFPDKTIGTLFAQRTVEKEGDEEVVHYDVWQNDPGEAEDPLFSREQLLQIKGLKELFVNTQEFTVGAISHGVKTIRRHAGL